MKIVARFFAVVCLSLPLLAQQPQAAEPNPEAIVKGNYQFTNGVAPGYWVYHYGTASLVVHVGKGTCFDSGEARHAYAGGTLTMTASATNYIYLATSSCTLSQNTTGYPVTGALPLATVVATSSVTSITDDRTWFNGLTGGQCPLSAGVNAKTTGYTLDSTDAGKLVTFSGSSLTATLPASPPSANWCARIQNLNASALTVSRNSLLINGGSSNLTLAQYQTVTCVTDNSNYFCTRPIVAGSNVTITESANQESIASSASGGISGATANGAMYATAATTGTSTGALTNGQVLIGDTGNPPQANTITAGAGIGVSNGAHSITISATGSTCSSGAPAVVGSIQASSGTPTTLGATIACNGSLVVIGITSASSATNPLTITGSCVTSWTLAKSSVAFSNKGWLYYGKSNTTGACTISSNVTCSSCSMVEAELSNTNATIDKTLADYSNGTASITTSLPALSNTNDVVVSLLGGFHTGWTASPTAPLTSIVTFNNVDASNLAWYQAPGASAQSFTWNITCCGSLWEDDNVILNAAFTTATGSAVFNQTVQVDGSGFAQEPVTDLISGTGITLSGADDSANTRTKVTVNRDALTGDVTTSGDAATLASVVTAGSCGDTTHSCGLTYDAKGRITVAANNVIASGTTPALVLLEQHTASTSAELDFTTCISATYDEYQIAFVNLVPATNGDSLALQMSTNGGSSYDQAAVYWWQSFAMASNAQGGNGVVGATATFLAVTNTSGNGANITTNGTIRLYNPGGSSFKYVEGTMVNATNTGQRLGWMNTGSYESTTAVNAFRVVFGSNGTTLHNITSGTVRCYGLAK